MAFTPSPAIQAILAKSSGSSGSVPSSSSGSDIQSILAKSTGAIPAPAPVSTGGTQDSIATAEAQKAPLVSNPMTDINAAGASVANDLSGTTGMNPIQAGLKGASDAAMAIPNAVADVIPGGKGLLGAMGKAFQGATDVAGNIGNTMADISQKLGLMSPEQRAQYDKQASDFANSTTGKNITSVADSLNSLGNIANVILGTKAATDTIPKIPGAIKNIPNVINEADKTIAKIKTDKAQAAIAKDWSKPGTQVGQPKYNAARQVLTKTPTIPKFLAGQKLDPRNFVESKNYATADAATMLRSVGGQLKGDMLAPSLKAADYSTPVTQASSLADSATANVSRYPGITATDGEAINAKIASELSALGRKYPSGMKLSDLDAEKIRYDANAGFNPIKSNADNNIAVANRAIGAALQKAVEDKAPATIPVKEFNQAISKYYKGADYLDALNGKKAPYSIIKTIAKKTLQGTGALLGSMTGGGILVDMAGYMIGGGLESVLEDMSPNLRNFTLRNLEISRPDVFAKVESYLKDPNGGQLKLPAAGAGTPIPLGPDTVTPKPNIAPHAAKAGYPLNVDPKTGRVMRTYTSAPDFGTAMKKK